MDDAVITASTQQLLRELAPQVLAIVMRRCQDFPAAEDAVQEALLAAALQWSRDDALPEQPRAWLTRVALRRLTDHVRAESARRRRDAIVVSLVPVDEQVALAAESELHERDDTLDMLFMCCHPALSATSAIALTLRAIGGLSTHEIAKAFMVPESTMAQRISRAKQSIKDSAVPLREPTPAEHAARMSAVRQVLYLMFNEGYTASSGALLQRTDLAHEALRLTRMLSQLAPQDAEVTGLLALMLLTDARRHARTGSSGELIALDEQDRSLWDRLCIEEGVRLISAVLPRGNIGPFQVQAAIAAVHDEAPSADETDWPQILALYDVLSRLQDSPVVALNRAVAVAMVQGPDAGLACLTALEHDPRLRQHHRLDAVRAHLLERAGRRVEAVQHYLRAAERTASVPERNYLLLRAARVRELQT